MAERDQALVALYAIRDAGLRPLADTKLGERVRTAIEREIALERDAGGPERVRRHAGGVGSLALALGALVTVAIAVGLVVVLHHGGHGRQPSAASRRTLVAQFAVLRRPQTAADRLPAHPRLVHLHGTIIPSLTRLLASPPGAKMYLIVSTPEGGPDALWNPKLGDQVSIATVSPHAATDTRPIPAVALNDARLIYPAGRASGRPAYEVALLPDGVARVRWTFFQGPGKPAHSIDARVSGNVAYAPYGPAGGIPLRGTWYATDGTPIPTSHDAYRRAQAAQQAAMKAALIREYAHYSYHAPAQLLSDFAVFSITSTTPVRTASGVTISRPPLSALPFGIVSFADPREPARLDPSQIRQVTMPSGISVWVIPGERGLCLAAISPSRLPGLGGGGGESCSSRLSQAEATGVAFNSGAGRTVTTYRLLPNSHPALRVRTGSARRTIRPPYGVYIATRHRRHR